MNRRSTKTKGFVNFPIEDPRYKNSHEGGMFVKIVVVDTEKKSKQFPVCCGNVVWDNHQEVLVGDDQRPKPKWGNRDELTHDDISKYDHEHEKWVSYHVPDWMTGYSIPYLASILIGTTGWSGWDESKGEYFTCAKDHLSADGLELHNLMQRLYPNATIHLLTFLDT